MKNFLEKILSESGLSSKRLISLVFALMAGVVFIYISFSSKTDAIRENLFNSVLIFIATLAGVSTAGSLFKKEIKNDKTDENNA